MLDRCLNSKPVIVWLTGLSGSGKTTLSLGVERILVDGNVSVIRLDGDQLRTGLNVDLGYTDADRSESVRRAAEVAALFASNGFITLVALISPFREGRQLARRIAARQEITFYEVFVDAPLEVCERRDPKGLYGKVRAQRLQKFTGIDSPYEVPLHPELALDTFQCSETDCVAKIISLIYSASAALEVS